MFEKVGCYLIGAHGFLRVDVLQLLHHILLPPAVFVLDFIFAVVELAASGGVLVHLLLVSIVVEVGLARDLGKVMSEVVKRIFGTGGQITVFVRDA